MTREHTQLPRMADVEQQLQAVEAEHKQLQEEKRVFQQHSLQLRQQAASTSKDDVERAHAANFNLLERTWMNIIARYTLIAHMNGDTDDGFTFDELDDNTKSNGSVPKTAGELQRRARPEDVDKQTSDLRVRFDSFLSARAGSAECMCDDMSCVCSLHEIAYRSLCQCLGLCQKSTSVRGALDSVRNTLKENNLLVAKKNMFVFRIDGVTQHFIPALGSRERKRKRVGSD